MPPQKTSSIIDLLISGLATWRLASLLVREDGPGDVFAKLRMISGVKYDKYSQPYAENTIGGILSCVWCCSVWVAAIVACVDKPVKLHTYILRALSLSAISIVIDEVIQKIQK